ncbi:MAG: VWA domain-containing protein [Verrucomicrobia bacterium]|nr:VWA domain-containing protein [Verrucomicrobiota bacterium]
MFRFANPFYFLLFLPLAAAGWWVLRRRITTGLAFAPLDRCRPDHGSWRTVASQLCPLVVLTGLALIITALARPQTILARIRQNADVIAIQMVVDVSGSMEALDMSDFDGNRLVVPRTRLDMVKETFAEFVKQRPDDLIGLITFGGYASTRSPLTPDHDAVLHILSGVTTPKPYQDANGRVSNQDELLTAIGDALATGCARMVDAELKSKIIVLLSDGESNTGLIDPLSAVEAARQLGIRVYTIGVGKTGRAPFRVRDVFGRERLEMANVTLDAKLLTQIAEETGGQYFNVQDPEGMARALQVIDTLEKTEIESDVFEHFDERFPFFLVPGFILALLGTSLNMLVSRRIV